MDERPMPCRFYKFIAKLRIARIEDLLPLPDNILAVVICSVLDKILIFKLNKAKISVFNTTEQINCSGCRRRACTSRASTRLPSVAPRT